MSIQVPKHSGRMILGQIDSPLWEDIPYIFPDQKPHHMKNVAISLSKIVPPFAIMFCNRGIILWVITIV